MAIDLYDALGPDAEQLIPYARRMIQVVERAGGRVTEIGLEFGAPEVRFRLALDHPEAMMKVRRELIRIQQAIP